MAGDMFACMACPTSPTFLRFTEVEHHLEEVHGVRGVLWGPATRAVLLPSTLTTHQCLLCEEGELVEEEQMQEHMSTAHGMFFARRWEEYSASTCRVCGEGVAGAEEEQHTALHHPRGSFARGGKEQGKAGVKVERKDENTKFKTEKAKVKVLVKVKENDKNGCIKTQEVKCKVQVEVKERDENDNIKPEKVDRTTLEEVTELGLVTRRPGEIRVKLTRGEADILLGRDARMVVDLKRKTGATIYIKGDYDSNERLMKIDGKEELVVKAEEQIVQSLTSKTYITIKLSKQELLCLLGVGGKSIGRIQDDLGVYINSGKRAKEIMEINEVTISGTPEAVASAQEFFNTGKVIEVTERQARILEGRGGRNIRDTTGTLIANLGKGVNTKTLKFIIFGSEEAKEMALKSMYALFEQLDV